MYLHDIEASVFERLLAPASHDGLPIDLNADVGDGFGRWRLGDDAALLEVVTSANIACGFHAGDPKIMHELCAMAIDLGVMIGAHVSFRDLIGFGCRNIDMSTADLVNEVLYQIGALDAIARSLGGQVRYVKPQGALYDRVVDDSRYASAIIEAVLAYDPGLVVLGMPDSELLHVADVANVDAVREGFGDRAYSGAGRLVPRSAVGAVINDPDAVVQRYLALATTGTVTAVDGRDVLVAPRSLCFHSDTRDADVLAVRVRECLRRHDIELAPFTAGCGIN